MSWARIRAVSIILQAGGARKMPLLSSASVSREAVAATGVVIVCFVSS